MLLFCFCLKRRVGPTGQVTRVPSTRGAQNTSDSPFRNVQRFVSTTINFEINARGRDVYSTLFMRVCIYRVYRCLCYIAIRVQKLSRRVFSTHTGGGLYVINRHDVVLLKREVENKKKNNNFATLLCGRVPHGDSCDFAFERDRQHRLPSCGLRRNTIIR